MQAARAENRVPVDVIITGYAGASLRISPTIDRWRRETWESERSSHINTNRRNKKKTEIGFQFQDFSPFLECRSPRAGMIKNLRNSFSLSLSPLFLGRRTITTITTTTTATKTIILMIVMMMMITIEIRLPTIALRKIIRYDFAKTSRKLSGITDWPSTCIILKTKKKKEGTREHSSSRWSAATMINGQWLRP